MNAFIPLLAQTGRSAESFTATEFDWPQTGWGMAALAGGFALLFVYAIWMSIRDSRELHPFWRMWLLALRLAAIAGLLVICLNPQERMQRMSFRPSRVAVLVDTSLSMRFPATGNSSSAPSANSQTRADAVRELLAESNLIPDLRKRHDVSVYTFDSSLAGPHGVLPSTNPRTAGNSKNTTDNETDASNDAAEADANTTTTAETATQNQRSTLRPHGTNSSFPKEQKHDWANRWAK